MHKTKSVDFSSKENDESNFKLFKISCQSCGDREIILVDEKDYEKNKSINLNTMCQNCIVERLKDLLDQAILINYKEDIEALKIALDFIENENSKAYSIQDYKRVLKQLNSLLLYWLKAYKTEKDEEIKTIYKFDSMALVFVINSMYKYSKEICGDEDKLWKTEISLWNKRKLGILQFL